jgi:hypothetical protein
MKHVLDDLMGSGSTGKGRRHRALRPEGGMPEAGG